ncbi:hypothetical protein BV25DRAFT_1823075, partial [Artomyces pyxidatus]
MPASGDQATNNQSGVTEHQARCASNQVLSPECDNGKSTSRSKAIKPLFCDLSSVRHAVRVKAWLPHPQPIEDAIDAMCDAQEKQTEFHQLGV